MTIQAGGVLAAAYGGAGWQPRTSSLRDEIGHVWSACGVGCEWAPLRAVLLHRPGPELAGLVEPDSVQMLQAVDASRARAQHDAMVQAYHEAGVRVETVDPPTVPPPNLMFVADLMWMTPEGAIVARPASTVRAGEEIFVSRRLAELGIPSFAPFAAQAPSRAPTQRGLTPTQCFWQRACARTPKAHPKLAGCFERWAST